MSMTDPPIFGSVSYIEDIVEQPHGTFDQNVELAAWNVLNTLQDVIVEDTGEPWPDASGDPLPLAETAVETGVLHLWYGGRDEPALALRPIPLPSRPS